jgi:hypothetical protein
MSIRTEKSSSFYMDSIDKITLVLEVFGRPCRCEDEPNQDRGVCMCFGIYKRAARTQRSQALSKRSWNMWREPECGAVTRDIFNTLRCS